jgi:hypothetical protein
MLSIPSRQENHFFELGEAPNGLRYPLVGGTRKRCFAGTSLKPHKRPENTQTPTSRVHAVLGTFCRMRNYSQKPHNFWALQPCAKIILLPLPQWSRDVLDNAGRCCPSPK